MNHADLLKDSVGLDVPVTRLRPLRERKITNREYDRIVASIKAVELTFTSALTNSKDNLKRTRYTAVSPRVVLGNRSLLP